MTIFIIEDGVLKPARRGLSVFMEDYSTQLKADKANKYEVFTDGSHRTFVIKFSIITSRWDVIYCENSGQLLYALALVRGALGT